MAETLISAGVLARENDQSFITQGPVTVGAAIIGPTVKGPVEVPTVVTSYSQYQNVFGTTLTSGSGVYTYFTSIAAYNYFNNGGESLLVARVTSGSFSSANATVYGESSTAAVTFETLAEGTLMNSSSSLNSDGSMDSGSVDNVRWEIVNRNTGSGTFDLLVRRGNDNTTEKVVLETWTDLSLDPLSTNYVAKRIGDQSFTYAADGTSYYLQTVGSYPVASKYLRVSTVNSPTPNYLDNTGTAKTAFTASIPLATGGGFENAEGGVMAGANFYDTVDSSNTQGVVGTDYTSMINLLSNTDDYKFNILLTPGLYNADYTSQATSIISNTQNRGDNLYVLDLVKYGQTVTSVTGQAKSRNTSYAASYWPWVQVIDPDTGTQVWVPASTVMGGVFAYNDAVSDPWFAPAGINRGGLGQVVRPERKLAQSTRDTLYTSKVNPIASFPGTGVVVYGQKTLQTRASALDRVNVRRLLIAMKSFISQIANNLVFEQNSIATRNNFLAQVNPYLEGIQQRQGLYAFKVVMDDSNNTADVIDRNQLVGQIYVQPTRTAEFIYLDFNITPTGAAFPA
jgi:phage tail sheath protein FI